MYQQGMVYLLCGNGMAGTGQGWKHLFFSLTEELLIGETPGGVLGKPTKERDQAMKLTKTEIDCLTNLMLTGTWRYSGSLTKAQRLATLRKLIANGYLNQDSFLPTAKGDRAVLESIA